MAFRSGTPSRRLLMGLAIAGVVTGTAGSASAQYYVYDDIYGYEEVPRRSYGYGYGYEPRPPAPVPYRGLGRVAARDLGLSRIDRTVRTGSSYIVDGRTANGGRTRLIFDLRSGGLVDRIILREAPRAAPPRIARTDPAQARPTPPRLTPNPPERPPALKPPGQANAPARATPPSPATPLRAPAPEKPAVPPQATAPATVVPPSPAVPKTPDGAPVRIIPLSPPAPPAAPEAPAPAEATAPATQPPSSSAVPAPAPDAAKPPVVNPPDTRGADQPEPQPPLAKADPSGISVAPVELPPVQIDDMAPAKPRAETPVAPVAPLE